MQDLEEAWMGGMRQMAMALPPEHPLFDVALRELGRRAIVGCSLAGPRWCARRLHRRRALPDLPAPSVHAPARSPTHSLHRRCLRAPEQACARRRGAAGAAAGAGGSGPAA